MAHFSTLSRRACLTSTVAAAALGLIPAVWSSARAQGAAAGPIKIGILHSLSGTMAISETTLKDVMLMLIDDAEQEGRRAWTQA